MLLSLLVYFVLGLCVWCVVLLVACVLCCGIIVVLVMVVWWFLASLCFACCVFCLNRLFHSSRLVYVD